MKRERFDVAERWQRAMYLYNPGPRRNALLTGCAVVAMLSLSVPAPAQDRVAMPGLGQALHLAAGDRINVTVFGQPDLSGDFVIDNEGNITVPLVGPLMVRNLTAAEVQSRLFDRLNNGILKHPTISVRASELRPIYVLGDVRTPGAYPFRPGSIVQSVVALAGGFGQTNQWKEGSEADFLAADERVRQLIIQRRALSIRLARIEAQRKGATVFPSPHQQASFGDDDDIELVAAETETFNGQAEILNGQLERLRAQKPRLQAEIEAMTAQITALKRQRDLGRQQTQEYDQLVKKGLGRSATKYDLMRNEARSDSDVWRLMAELSHLKVTVGDLDIKIGEVEANFKRAVLGELAEVRQRLKETDVLMQSAAKIREVRSREAPGGSDDRIVLITRTGADGERTVITSTDTTILLPGDVVEVKRRELQPAGWRSVQALPPLPDAKRTAQQLRRADGKSLAGVEFIRSRPVKKSIFGSPTLAEVFSETKPVR